jgi:hypothetical protein
MAYRLSVAEAKRLLGEEKYKERTQGTKKKRAASKSRASATAKTKSKYKSDGISFRTLIEVQTYDTIKKMFERGEIVWYCRNAKAPLLEKPAGVAERVVDYIVCYPDGRIEEKSVPGRKQRYTAPSKKTEQELEDAKANKMHAKRTVVGGVFFHSRKEAKIYSEYFMMYKSGHIKMFYRQCNFLLDSVDDERVEYKSDFLIVHNDGTVEHIEV